MIKRISRRTALNQAWLSRLKKVRRHQESFHQDEKIDRRVDTSEYMERRVKQSERV